MGTGAIDISINLLPLDCSALPNRLTGAVRFPSIWEPSVALLKHDGQVIRNGVEGKRRVGPKAACDPVGHAQVSAFEQEQQRFVIHFQGLPPRILRTEVRPKSNRRAISDLLMPARCSFRISVA